MEAGIINGITGMNAFTGQGDLGECRGLSILKYKKGTPMSTVNCQLRFLSK